MSEPLPTPKNDAGTVECLWDGIVFDGTYYRWCCPGCGTHYHCCEGGPSQ